MKQISKGEFEVFSSKLDTINKLMQLQGVCQETIGGERRIEFYCSKRGKIAISNPPTRHERNWVSTYLFGKVIERDNKTYVTYYTTFSRYNHFLKLFCTVIDIIVGVLAIVFLKNIFSFFVMLLCLVFFVYQLFISVKEKSNSPKDSEILINELAKRIDAVNNWDK